MAKIDISEREREREIVVLTSFLKGTFVIAWFLRVVKAGEEILTEIYLKHNQGGLGRLCSSRTQGYSKVHCLVQCKSLRLAATRLQV